MERLRVALVQLAWPGQRAAMQETYHRLVKSAAQQGAALVCLPEFSLSPYFASHIDPSGFQWAEPLRGGPSDAFFGELARIYGLLVVGSLFEQAEDGRYFDTATVHNPQGQLIHFTRKVHIPAGEGYHEDHFFEGDVAYPVHNLGFIKMATPTCYDQWFPEMARICALNGAEFIFYPTAIGSEPEAPDFDSQPAWEAVMRGHAIANGVYVAAANRVGQEAVRFYGSSFICDPTGRLLVQAGRDTTEVIVADLDPQVLNQWRSLFPLLHQRRPQTYGRILDAYDQEPPPRWRDILKKKD